MQGDYLITKNIRKSSLRYLVLFSLSFMVMGSVFSDNIVEAASQKSNNSTSKATVILPIENNKIEVATVDSNIAKTTTLENSAVIIPEKSKAKIIDTVSKLHTVESSYTPDKNIVADAAYASMAVYNGEEHRLAWKHLESVGYKLTLFKVHKNRFLWAHKIANEDVKLDSKISSDNGDVDLLAIAGTESKAGWRLNFNTDTEAFEGASDLQVHKGYYALSKAIIGDSEVQNIITRVKSSKDGRLVITGHSLGGAVSLITSLLLQDRNLISKDKYETIVFGSPMIGNNKLAASTANIRYKAYEMDNDFVPKAFQLIYDRYREYLPGRVKWKSHMPPLTISHSMIMYIDEAELQRSELYKDDIDSQHNLTNSANLYSPRPQVDDKVSIEDNVINAYTKGLQHILYIENPNSVISYKKEDLSQALAYAKENQIPNVLWQELKFINNKKSQVNNYRIQVIYSLYDSQTGVLKNQSYHIIKDGGYTLLANTLESARQDLKNILI